MTGSASDFDVAKSVAELLEKLDRGRQELVLRWVRESLHLDPAVLASPARMAPVELDRSNASSDPSPSGPPGTRPVDIKSFTDEKRPKSDMQFSAVVAYYYRFVAPSSERREVISAEVLQEAARLAGRTRPPKPSMTLTNAKNQGYLDSHGRGEFKLNTVGENLVAMTLPGEGTTARPSVRRGGRSSAKSPRDAKLKAKR